MAPSFFCASASIWSRVRLSSFSVASRSAAACWVRPMASADWIFSSATSALSSTTLASPVESESLAWSRYFFAVASSAGLYLAAGPCAAWLYAFRA